MTTMYLTPEVGQAMQEKVANYSRTMPRSQQSTDGILGISDIGGCREYARLRTLGTPNSDVRSLWKADIGTAIHAFLDDAFKAAYGDDVLTGVTVTCTYPNGATMPGHPDLVFPAWSVVVDIKTVDGLHGIRRTGPTNRQWTQVMSYGKALHDDGTFPTDKPVRCVLLFVDRSGREDDFVTFERELDLTVLAEAADWIDDVTYAVTNDEQASKDKPIDFCIQYCDFYSICRAEDAAPEGGLIEDEDVISAADLYLEGMRMERDGKSMKNEAKGQLLNVAGSTPRATIRWTKISPSEVPQHWRDGYDRLDVRPIKTR